MRHARDAFDTMDEAARLEAEADRARASAQANRPSYEDAPARYEASREKLARARALRPHFFHSAVAGPVRPEDRARRWRAEAAALTDRAYALAVSGREVESDDLLFRADQYRTLADTLQNA